MPAGQGDPRKRFLLTTVHNYFGLPAGEEVADCTELNRFLDDASEFVLSARRTGARVVFSNKVGSSDTKEKALVYFKIRPDVITEDNLHDNVLVSSMLDSPINTLYQSVRQIFAPLLLKDEKWSKEFDPKLQTLLSELEAGLGSVLRRPVSSRAGSKSGGEESLQGIITPSDEFQFWAEMPESKSKPNLMDRAFHFTNLFQTIEKYYNNLDNLPLAKVVDVVETTKETVDDVWRQTEHEAYPEPRMKHLLEIIGNAFGRSIQKNLGALNLWSDPFPEVKENLRAGIAICEQWTAACEHLTGQLWQRYTPHPWKSEKYFPESLHKLGKRLEEVLTIRVMYEKLAHFLPSGEDRTQRYGKVFEPFSGLNPVHYNPYTEPLWRAAVSQYERIIEPAEEKIASKLKSYFSEILDSPQQLLQAFQKHKEMVKRPNVRKQLITERETLLARLLDYIKDIQSDFETRCHGSPGESSGPLSGKNLPEVVNNIVWVRQLQLKVEDSMKIAEALLSDLSGCQSVHKNATELLEQFKEYEQEQFSDWSREIQAGLSDPKSGFCIQPNSQVMELDHSNGALKIYYSDRLITLLREVRQLSALGLIIPAKIQQASKTAQKFYKQAMILKQVAHFYNTIDQQMIESQRPMMLKSALAFEKIIKNSRANTGEKDEKARITWDNPKELQSYIEKLQSAAEQLSTENRKLRKKHTDFSEKVAALMNVDLLRQQQRWKDGLMEMRTVFSNLEYQGMRSSDMKAWRQHWDHQLYKALEHQYQMGLEALNENLPEITIDLTFKQGRLQFKPPYEEIRAKYYRDMKRFISIPNQFRGLSEPGEEPIFTAMPDRNANGLITVFSKAEDLFRRLSAVMDRFKEWVVIGQVDVDALIEKNLREVHDWEKNFKALKIRGKEAERIPSTIKIDCMTINCNPVKMVIDDLIQKLFDSLVISLKRSIQANLHEIDSFVSDGMEMLSSRPQSIEEIGEASKKHGELKLKKPEILPLFKEAEDKNRLLRSVAGSGLDTISNLRAKWDKFELMIESHQLMVKEQIEIMKENVKVRVKIYTQELEKFKARWDQFKPGDDIIESGNEDTLEKSAQSIKEKKMEFDELEATKNKLM